MQGLQERDAPADPDPAAAQNEVSSRGGTETKTTLEPEERLSFQSFLKLEAKNKTKTTV